MLYTNLSRLDALFFRFGCKEAVAESQLVEASLGVSKRNAGTLPENGSLVEPLLLQTWRSSLANTGSWLRPQQ